MCPTIHLINLFCATCFALKSWLNCGSLLRKKTLKSIRRTKWWLPPSKISLQRDRNNWIQCPSYRWISKYCPVRPKILIHSNYIYWSWWYIEINYKVVWLIKVSFSCKNMKLIIIILDVKKLILFIVTSFQLINLSCCHSLHSWVRESKFTKCIKIRLSFCNWLWSSIDNIGKYKSKQRDS